MVASVVFACAHKCPGCDEEPVKEFLPEPVKVVAFVLLSDEKTYFSEVLTNVTLVYPQANIHAISLPPEPGLDLFVPSDVPSVLESV